MQKRSYNILWSIILFLIALNVLFYFISPETIVSYIGVENSYLVVFAASALGGLSALTGTVLYTAVVTFAAGGANKILLGLSAGFGIFISDSIFFLLASWGRRFIPEGWEGRVSSIKSLVRTYPTWVVLIFIYLYLALLPLPNDILMIALVLGGYKYKEIFGVVLAGSITIGLLAAYFGSLLF